MSSIGKAVGKVVGGITGSTSAAEGAQKGAATQAQAAEMGIEEQRRQFDAIQKLLSPFVTAGTGALGEQQALLGLLGPEAQQRAMINVEGSPGFQNIYRQGEDALLQNVSATGGLRGGNVQAALAKFRPQLLNQFVEQRFANLGGLTGIGQASAAQQASAGQATGANVANLLGQRGAAMAGGQLAKGGAQRQAFGDLLQIGGAIGGAFF